MTKTFAKVIGSLLLIMLVRNSVFAGWTPAKQVPKQEPIKPVFVVMQTMPGFKQVINWQTVSGSVITSWSTYNITGFDRTIGYDRTPKQIGCKETTATRKDWTTYTAGRCKPIYNKPTGLAIYAHRTIKAYSTHIDHEYVTPFNHVREQVASCKSGLEYFNQMSNIKPLKWNKRRGQRSGWGYYQATITEVNSSGLSSSRNVICLYLNTADAQSANQSSK